MITRIGPEDGQLSRPDADSMELRTFGATKLFSNPIPTVV